MFYPWLMLSSCYLHVASCLLLHCPQIKLIEGELMQLTKLEVKRRSLNAENLQVGVTTMFICFLHLYTHWPLY